MDWNEWLRLVTVPFVSTCKLTTIRGYPGMEIDITVRLLAVSLDHAKQQTREVLYKREIREAIARNIQRERE